MRERERDSRSHNSIRKFYQKLSNYNHLWISPLVGIIRSVRLHIICTHIVWFSKYNLILWSILTTILCFESFSYVFSIFPERSEFTGSFYRRYNTAGVSSHQWKWSTQNGYRWKWKTSASERLHKRSRSFPRKSELQRMRGGRGGWWNYRDRGEITTETERRTPSSKSLN